MQSHARGRLIAGLLVLALGACARTPAAMLRGELGGPEVPMDTLASNQIPSDWGRLAAVTPDPLYRTGVLLWFEDEAGNVRMIGYDRNEYRFWKYGRIIRRSSGR